ncbi:DUF2634 domain-containing protein [Lentilactobacillus otakiensis]|uniref:DUF2634 domain-containing protein n=1 Tax=Lentilactobacillus otakiensis TaxID=481720 RepID=UPI003D17400C
MARDLMIDPKTGDFVIDPNTHDLAMVEGADEIAQRIRATWDIYYGEMSNLDSEIGSDYSNLLGKNPNFEYAADDMEAAVIAQVPEVVSFDSVNFTKLSNRHVQVDFVATYIDEDQNEQQTEGGYEIGS